MTSAAEFFLFVFLICLNFVPKKVLNKLEVTLICETDNREDPL